MPILNDKEYKCDFCGEICTFIRDETWSEEKAKEEFNRNFPYSDWNKREIVCDDCWKIVRP